MFACGVDSAVDFVGVGVGGVLLCVCRCFQCECVYVLPRARPRACLACDVV